MSIYAIDSLVKVLKGDYAGAIGQVVRHGPHGDDVDHTVHISPPLRNANKPEDGIKHLPTEGKWPDVGHVVEVTLPGSALEPAPVPGK